MVLPVILQTHFVSFSFQSKTGRSERIQIAEMCDLKSRH